jgi:hypothetical protein
MLEFRVASTIALHCFTLAAKQQCICYHHRFASEIDHHICDILFGGRFRKPPLTAVTKYWKHRGFNSQD